ncbi:MAG: PfkB family carbohydrate kinase, partial [Candidatus Aenigmatarchaeota archaeon]
MILVVGSVALDTVKTPLNIKKEVLGGSAIYFSLSASFFNRVNLVGVVGSDFPSKYLNILKNKNIDLKGLKICSGKTFRWEGEYGLDLNNPKTLATHLNVFSNFRPMLPKKYKNCRYVFLANIDPKIQEEVLSQVNKPKLIGVDTMDHWIIEKRNSLIKFLRKVDVFFLNEKEARLLSQENNLLKAAKTIKRFGPKNIIIKKGEDGALFFSSIDYFCLPAFLLEKVIDPTGAGDAFAGGVMGYLSKKGSIDIHTFKEAI